MFNKISIGIVLISTLAPLEVRADTLVCAIKDIKNPARYESVIIDLEKASDDDVFQSKKGLDFENLNLSFDVTVNSSDENLGVDVVFYENNQIEDEIGSASWSIDRDAVIAGKPVITEPLSLRNKNLATFVCYYNKAKPAEQPSTTTDAKATIEFVDDENLPYVVSLNSHGEPKIFGTERSYPTIKDFDRSGDYHAICWRGESRDVIKLLEALVEAANGDGDSYATLEKISRKPNGTYVVSATIVDESGSAERTFNFASCL